MYHQPGILARVWGKRLRGGQAGGRTSQVRFKEESVPEAHLVPTASLRLPSGGAIIHPLEVHDQVALGGPTATKCQKELVRMP